MTSDLTFDLLLLFTFYWLLNSFYGSCPFCVVCCFGFLSLCPIHHILFVCSLFTFLIISSFIWCNSSNPSMGQSIKLCGLFLISEKLVSLGLEDLGELDSMDLQLSVWHLELLWNLSKRLLPHLSKILHLLALHILWNGRRYDWWLKGCRESKWSR